MNKISKSNITLSIRDGLYMPFMYKGNQVVIHNSAWSFREKIWVNDDLVINQLGYRLASEHQIKVEDEILHIRFGFRDKMSEVFLDVLIDDQPFYRLSEKIGEKQTTAQKIIGITVSLLCGIGFGYALASWLV